MEEGSYIVHSGTVGNALRPGTVFHVLFDTGMQITGTHPHVANIFPIEFRNQAQHPVRRGVNRPDIHHDSLIGEFFDFGSHFFPVSAMQIILRSVLGN